MLKK
ncbi:hypothetical protein N7465_012008 [Penicillium sp. CMV-2018d]|jgi:hypothetical protein